MREVCVRDLDIRTWVDDDVWLQVGNVRLAVRLDDPRGVLDEAFEVFVAIARAAREAAVAVEECLDNSDDDCGHAEHVSQADIARCLGDGQ